MLILWPPYCISLDSIVLRPNLRCNCFNKGSQEEAAGCIYGVPGTAEAGHRLLSEEECQVPQWRRRRLNVWHGLSLLQRPIVSGGALLRAILPSTLPLAQANWMRADKQPVPAALTVYRSAPTIPFHWKMYSLFTVRKRKLAILLENIQSNRHFPLIGAS